MTRVYLIRHAEAEGNIYRRAQGRYDGAVSAKGLRQIAALAERFRNEPIDALYTSDLARTRCTAGAITKYHALEMRPEPRLREIDLGPWENQPFGWLERTDSESLAAFGQDPEHWLIPGAEPYEQYSARFLEALTELAKKHEGQSIAVFTHGCVLSGGLHRLLGLPHDASQSDNTAVSLLRYENGSFSPVFLFDNSHLSAEISTRARRQRARQLLGGRLNLWFREAEASDAVLYAPELTPAPGDRVWIGMLDETPVGYTAVSETGLTALWLKPEYRHRRLGDQLFGQAVAVLRADGVKAITIPVSADNSEATAFFLHLCGNPVQTDCRCAVFRTEIGISQT